MKELNIAKSLITKRKDKGITQDELAAYIGVSKASVSKWETGQSYPDITFLPQLATYFNISIDELIGYAPQMTKEGIKRLYHRLTADFSVKPFDAVIAECHEIIRKYYSCFPLLLQMAILLVNHHMLAKDKDTGERIVKEALELCTRIEAESEDAWLAKEALSFKATCYLFLQEPQSILELLGESVKPTSADGEMIAQAYQMLGNIPKARETTQICMYQHLVQLLSAMPFYLMLNANDPAKAEEVLQRAISMIKTFELDKLTPNTTLQIYLAAAQLYVMHGNTEKALDMLQKYSSVCSEGFFPFSLHGDPFFDAIDGWFADFDLGAAALRDEKVIKENMLQGIVANPTFAILADQPRYKMIIDKLKAKKEVLK